MRLLLDTHTSLWAVDNPSLLGSQAKIVLEDLSNFLLVSAATVWEMAIKVGTKKLDLSFPYRQWMTQAIRDLGVSILPVTVEYADVQAGLYPHHNDPFDRLLIAQVLYEQVSIVSVASA
ncbi:MAG: type II toxin-antitoxin system VapC family toxin [Deltaproteobacteria bacterium]|nr:type II toxin-antitoxin system VapC family toxin [Deltaproteobacteria bacterium]